MKACVMNKTLVIAMFGGIFVFSSVASAESENTVSVGYAQSHVKFHGQMLKDDPQGFNIKYRYEFDDKWGMIGSFVHTGQEYNYYYDGKKVGSGDLDYYSLTAGPIYRFNNYISAYGMIGASHVKAKSHASSPEYSYKYNETDTALAYGAGLQFNPVSNITVDASYEYSKLNNFKAGTWMLGVGYRF